MSGLRVLCVGILAFIGWPGGATRAEPVLLASFDHTSAGGVIPSDAELLVEVILFHERTALPFEVRELGRNIFWEDGQSGVVDFDSYNEPDFEGFTDRITDGIDEHLGVHVLSEDGGAGSGGPESF
jgi:hypothetical protein